MSSVAIINSQACFGLTSPKIIVEVDLVKGLPGLTIVGLPETAVKESKDRVKSAIINSGFEFPSKKIIVNLAPADLPKEGGRYDLPIAIGILQASGQIHIDADNLQAYILIGELALAGELRSVNGWLNIWLNGQTKQKFIIPKLTNELVTSLPAPKTQIFMANTLKAVLQHLENKNMLPELAELDQLNNLQTNQNLSTKTKANLAELPYSLASIKDQPLAKQALLTAAAGGHNLLLIGSPGSGKTMLANLLSFMLPDLSAQERLETAAIYALNQDLAYLSQRPPLRKPHHTIPVTALVGGGRYPRPGEISLAHNGVLFLDELAEFDKRALEALREPLETGEITIARTLAKATFPAQFQLIATMNPCPCGYYNPREKVNGRCRCTLQQIKHYRNKISGPLLDRFDMVIEVRSVNLELILEPTEPNMATAMVEPEELILTNIYQAQQLQLHRQTKLNSRLNTNNWQEHIKVPTELRQQVLRLIKSRRLSARGYVKYLKVARTIADLQAREQLCLSDFATAISYFCG